MNVLKGSHAAVVIFLLFILHCGALYGNDGGAIHAGGMGVQVSAGAGMLYGAMGEYVYSGGRKKSELNWDMKPLYIFQLSGALAVDEQYFFSLRYCYGHPGKSGRVTDTDWDFPIPGSVTVSKHKGVTLLYHEIEGAFSFSLLSRRGIEVKGGLSYLLMVMEAEARNGTVYVDGVQTGTLSGQIIRYSQAYQVLPFHINTYFRLTGAFSMEAALAYTPFLFCSATDMHFETDTQYDDRINWGHFIEGSLEAAWRINRRVEVFAGSRFRWIPPASGNSREMAVSTGIKEPWTRNTAGISLIQVSFLLGAALYWDL